MRCSITTIVVTISVFFFVAQSCCAIKTLEDLVASSKNSLPQQDGPVVERFVLVDASNHNEGDIITLSDDPARPTMVDTRFVGTALSIRAELNSNNNNNNDGCVALDLNNGSSRRITRFPYYLAGVESDSENTEEAGAGKPYPAYSMAKRGTYTITACPSECGIVHERPEPSQGEMKSGCKTIKFLISDGTASATIDDILGDLTLYDKSPEPASIFGALSGDLQQWHTVTLGFTGAPASEVGSTLPGPYGPPNTFADYRLDVTFTHPDSDTIYIVPGYYGGNGDIANSRGSNGNVWFCHFVPDRTGVWNWTASYKHGTNVVQNGGGDSADFFDTDAGSFIVSPSDKVGRDFRGKGRLSITNGRWQFANGEYMIKIGPNSPSNLLAYEDFDNTPNNQNYLKKYAAHSLDYNDGDVTWAAGKGRNLLGAINYLSEVGVNVLTITTLNLDNGDDENIFPFVNPVPISTEQNLMQYDISKLAQWQIIFSHAEKMGVALQFKLMDSNDMLLDNGKLHETMKLYFREMVARYGHFLSIVWDLGTDLSVSNIQTRSDYLKSIDPYQNPVAVSTHGTTYQNQLSYIGSLDSVTLLSESPGGINPQLSSYASSGLVLSSIEVGTGVEADAEDPDYDTVRQYTLWSALMGGSSTVQFHFTGVMEPDLEVEDFRSRAHLWEQTAHAMTFFHQIPFHELVPSNGLVSVGSYCLSDSTQTLLVVYMKKTANRPVVDLSGQNGHVYTVQWYSPMKGGQLVDGGLMDSGMTQSVGAPPSSGEDWVILIKCVDCA